MECYALTPQFLFFELRLKKGRNERRFKKYHFRVSLAVSYASRKKLTDITVLYPMCAETPLRALPMVGFD